MLPGAFCQEITDGSRRSSPAPGGRGHGRSRAELRGAAADIIEVQQQEMGAQLDRHMDVLLTRIEELFERQQDSITKAMLSVQYGAPLDGNSIVTPAGSHRSNGIAPMFVAPSAGPLGPGASLERFGAAGGLAQVVDAETQTGTLALPSSGVTSAVVTSTSLVQMENGGLDDKDDKEDRLREMKEATKNIHVSKGNDATADFIAAEDAKFDVPMDGKTWWQKIVMGQRFDMICGFLILANALVMIVQLEWDGLQIGYALGQNSYEEADWPGTPAVWIFFDNVFCIIFAVELGLRIGTYGTEFFKNVFNWIDIVTVVLTILELYVFSLLDLAMPKLSFFRLLRLLKLVKVLRIVRVMRLFHQLRVLVVAIISSISALIWSIIFLSMVQSIAAIFMTQVMIDILEDDSRPMAIRRESYHYFGRWSQSALTMYEITLAPGTWGPIGRLLIFHLNSLFVFFFIPYGWMVTFAVVRVVGAMFLKQTIQAASGDGEVAIIERMEKKEKDSAKLRHIFAAADTDGSGCVDKPEFEAMLDKPMVKAWLGMLDLDVHDMNMLFNLLDDGDGHIEFDEFISGVMRCRGGARGVDVAALLSNSRRVLADIESIREYMESAGYAVTKIVASGDQSMHAVTETDEVQIQDLMDANEEMDGASREDNKCKSFIKSRTFDIIAGFIICVNAIVMAVELEYRGLILGAKLGVNTWAEATWNNAPTGFVFMDYFFCNVFALELFLRIWAFGSNFFYSIMNWVDICTVVAPILELYIFALLQAKVPSMMMLRLLRLLKLTKVARLFRVMRLFHQLRVLVTSITATVGALVWSIVFLAVVQGIAAILMTQVLSDYLKNPDQATEDQLAAYEFFGRWSQSMLTMHQITLAPGAWPSIGRLLIFHVSPAFVLFFVPFGWGVTFAMVNVISAIFLKQTLVAAADDGEVAIMERMAKKKADIARLREIFSEGDKDGSGSVDWSEFQTMIQNPRVRAWLGILELDVTDMATVFNLLDDGDGQIEFEEFISGVMKCRGAARGVEVVALIAEFQQIQSQIVEIRRVLPQCFDRAIRMSMSEPSSPMSPTLPAMTAPSSAE